MRAFVPIEPRFDARNGRLHFPHVGLDRAELRFNAAGAVRDDVERP
jgi:hypothetical protein